MLNFALVGAAGYVAPRHLSAVKETGNNLALAIDPNDSVGILDSYFPSCLFLTDFKEFISHIKEHNADKFGPGIDYVSICSPNYLHFEQMCAGLEAGSNVICEKPMVIDVRNLDELKRIEQKTGKKAYSIFQLRLHPSIIDLRKKIEGTTGKKTEVNLKYVTRRGPWYHVSWKGHNELSGGLAMNIGIHFFDALIWIFGGVEKVEVDTFSDQKIAGTLELEKASVNWFLSIDYDDLPESRKLLGKAAYRSITMNGKELDFTDGFTDLHTTSYEQILLGNGIGIENARAALELVDQINKKGHSK